MASKLTGKASSFVYNANTIPITKYAPKGNRKLADTTDSTNYDAASGLVWNSQLACSANLELDVEGFYYTTNTDSQVVAELFSGNAAVAAVLNLDAGDIFGHGNFDISNFEASVPIEDTVSWKATFKSNGVFTHGS